MNVVEIIESLGSRNFRTEQERFEYWTGEAARALLCCLQCLKGMDWMKEPEL